ncbi:NAD(P)/FAD-dependent oxidoreductase [Candidatus Phycorickettsia trachydisci]|nr:NAD(P)/FAD-dependent oxidoreductase [Candidatus Phycorickettsia trachydisci]
MMDLDVLIVGAGPAGIFASFQAGMLGMSSAILDILPHSGGQCIELYPDKPIYDIAGLPKILAKDLISNLKEQASPFNPKYYFNTQAINIKELPDNRFEVNATNNLTIVCKIVIIASGNGAFVPNKPSIENLDDFETSSVFYSVKDPELFRNKNVLIAGGGDSAIDWAINLSRTAKNIYLVHRRDKFRCAPASLEKVMYLKDQGLIQFLTPYQVMSIEGQSGYIEKAVLQNFITNEIKTVELDYLLAFFGLKMDLGPIKDWGLEIENNKIKVDNCFYQTNRNGIYAIGDVCHYEGKLKLILTSFAEAASAIHHAYSKVFDGKQLHFEYSTNKGIPN